MQNQILSVLTIIVSIIALSFSILAYKRGGSMENENHLFKLKIEVYSKILSELYKLLDTLQDHFKELKQTLDGPSIEIATKVEDQAKKVDILCFEFLDFIVNQSLIIPESILVKLTDFTSKIIDNRELPDHYSAIDELENLLTVLMEDANNINVALRNDLHIEKLNISMYKRLH